MPHHKVTEHTMSEFYDDTARTAPDKTSLPVAGILHMHCRAPPLPYSEGPTIQMNSSRMKNVDRVIIYITLRES